MDERQLLFSVTKKDLKIEPMLSSKSGGQRRDKVKTAIRITHPDSGAVGFSQDERLQIDNKRIAFQRLVQSEEFVSWLKIEAAKYQVHGDVGLGVRWKDEVIRTYHFPTGIVRDHRDGSKYNLKKFMDGQR